VPSYHWGENCQAEKKDGRGGEKRDFAKKRKKILCKIERKLRRSQSKGDSEEKEGRASEAGIFPRPINGSKNGRGGQGRRKMRGGKVHA